MAISAIFLATGFDWKKAKWLKAEDPAKRFKNQPQSSLLLIHFVLSALLY
jgi:hypothetical protein